MLELRTPQGTFDLDPNFRIVLVDTNNALDWENTINITRTYPATLPWTRNNAWIWQHADRQNTNLQYDSLPCDVLLNGSLEFRGRVYLLRTTEGKSYDITVTYDREIFDPQALLNEINYPETLSEPFTEGGSYNLWNFPLYDMVNAQYGDTPCVLPVFHQLNNTDEYVNHYNITTAEYYGGKSMVPMFFAGYVIDQLCLIYGLQHKGAFKTDANLKKLIFFNTYVQQLVTYSTFGGPVYLQTEQPLEMKNHLPDITVSAFFNLLRVRFGIGVELNTRLNTLTIYTMRDILRSKKVIDVTEHVKGWGPQQFNSEKVGIFEQVYDRQDANVRFIKPYPPSYLGTKADLTDLVVTTPKRVGDTYLVLRDEYYWRWDGASWGRLQWNYYTEFNIGTGSTIKDESSSIITNHQYDPITSKGYKTPHTEYDKEDFEQNKIKAETRWLLYHGLQPTLGTTDTYPYASMDSTDSNGIVLGDLELRDHGVNGQYEQYKKYRAQMREQNRRPLLYLKKSAAVIANIITPDTTIRVKSQEYLWLEKRRVYDNRGLVEVELNLIKK